MGFVAFVITLLISVPTMPAQPAQIALVGDSIATSFAPRWADDHSRPGCGITNGIPQETGSATKSEWCAATAHQMWEQVFATSPDVVVVYSTWEVNNHRVAGELLEFRSPIWDAWYTSYLDWIRSRVPVLLLASVAPRAPIDGIVTMTPRDVARTRSLNDFHRAYAAQHVTVDIVDTEHILCPDTCPEWIGNVRPRPDMGAHFDTAGAAWFNEPFRTAVLDAWLRVGTLYAQIDGVF